MYDTIIKQYAKENVKDFKNEFYDFIYILLNNLIEIDIDKKLKVVFLNYLMFEKTIIFFKDTENNLQISRIATVLTRDENLFPLDITVRTISGKTYDLTEDKYIMMFNPIPTDYLKLKIDEIASIENITQFVRKLYKTPIIFLAKDSKVVKAIKDFIKKLFSTEEICTIVNDGFDVKDNLKSIELKIPYITDKLLDENESLKEDILEILGIYKNTSGTRERVNEAELLISNSLTTVNKLGIESSLENIIKEVNTKFGKDYKVSLNINKIFGIMNQDKTKTDNKESVK